MWQLLNFDSISQHPWMLCAPLEVTDRAALPDGKAAGTGLFICSRKGLELEYAAFLSAHTTGSLWITVNKQIGKLVPWDEVLVCAGFLDVHPGPGGMWQHSSTEFSIIYTSAPSQKQRPGGKAVLGSDEVFWEAWRAGNVSDPPLDRAVTHVHAELSSLPELQQRVPRAALANRNLPWSILSTAIPSARTELALKSENVLKRQEKWEVEEGNLWKNMWGGNEQQVKPGYVTRDPGG